MDKCIYNKKIINSFDVAADIDLEMEIRQCNSLKCSDPECNAPVRYKHGKIRIPHFAHITANTDCDYEKYSSKKSDLFQLVQQELYQVLKMKYPQTVDIDIKLIKNPSHYTPITQKGTKSSFAIDITDKRITANTLQLRKDTYSELGYTGIQVIIDEAMNCELSERDDLYLPVRYELNKSENNAAVVYDKLSKKYYYLRYDSNPMYKHFYPMNVMSREFSINEIELTEEGLSVPRLDKEYIKWVESKQIRYNEHLENLKEAEVKRKQTAKIIEDAKLSHNTVLSKPKITKPVKPPFDPVEFHKQTGKYAGRVTNGVREALELNEIKINKGIQNYFKEYSEKEMEDLINNAFSYQILDIRQMINKMYHANHDEKAVFVRIYEELLNSEQTYETAEKLKILEYAITEAEIFE